MGLRSITRPVSLGTHAVVCVPQDAASKQVERIEALDATLLCHRTDSDEAEAHARIFAQTHGLTYIPSYNEELGLNVEGAARVAAAAMLADQERRPEARAGVVVGGGNASQEFLGAL